LSNKFVVEFIRWSPVGQAMMSAAIATLHTLIVFFGHNINNTPR
jgi:hypothetical protein